MSGIEAYDIGRQDGVDEENARIIELFENSDSACADWAIHLVKKDAE